MKVLTSKLTAASWLMAGLMLLVFVLAPAGHRRYAMAVVGPFAFACVQQWLPSCRPVATSPLCPWNWALGVFFIQLVGMPLLLLFFGAGVGVLPYLPSSGATNGAMALNVIAFVTFAWSYQRISSRCSQGGEQLLVVGQQEDVAGHPGARLTLLCIVLGIFGLLLTFGGIAGISDYFNDPLAARELLLDLSSTFRGVAAIVLRPFLGFAVVLIWCGWLDRHAAVRSVLIRALITLLFVSALTLANLTLGYNRGAFVVPLAAMVAVVLRKAHWSSVALLALFGTLVLALAPALALYRSGLLKLDDATDDGGLQEVVLEKIDPVDYVQMYASAPQYLGYLLEATHWGVSPRWGSVVVSSILSPVPVLGKPFRAGSGTAIYNNLIYGTPEIQDQVVPFQGELFLDFHILGVIAGYVLLGWITCKLQRKFQRSKSSVELYIWQCIAIWVSFLIFGSISVVSQIFIYSFWSFYLYMCVLHLRRRRKQERHFQQALQSPVRT
jgi:oligosaccharide repeat unit polymerase